MIYQHRKVSQESAGFVLFRVIRGSPLTTVSKSYPRNPRNNTAVTCAQSPVRDILFDRSQFRFTRFCPSYYLIRRVKMSTEHESMMGILKLYELRSEEAMRKARDWFATGFYPESTQDILDVLMSEDSAKFRMVVSYWDMATAFVVFGSINDEMFNAINTEHVVVYAKLEPFLTDLRAISGIPAYLTLTHLEPVVLRMPDAAQRVATMRSYLVSRRQSPDRGTKED